MTTGKWTMDYMARLVLVIVLPRWLRIVWMRRFSHSLMALSQLATKSGSSLSTTMGLTLICNLVGVRLLAIALDRDSWWFEALSWMSISSRYCDLKASFSFRISVSRSQSLLEDDGLLSSGLFGCPMNCVKKSSWSKSSLSDSVVWGVAPWPLLLVLLLLLPSAVSEAAGSAGISSWLVIFLSPVVFLIGAVAEASRTGVL